MIKKQKEGKKGKIKVDRMKKGTEIVGSHDQRVEPLETRRPKERERERGKKEREKASVRECKWNGERGWSIANKR